MKLTATAANCINQGSNLQDSLSSPKLHVVADVIHFIPNRRRRSVAIPLKNKITIVQSIQIWRMIKLEQHAIIIITENSEAYVYRACLEAAT